MIVSSKDAMPTNISQPLNNQNGSAPSAQGGGSSLQNSFLTMLTAELRNQDPTNPMDSTQMVTQLSQISTSQGISDLKKIGQSQILAMMGDQRLESTQLIGKSVNYRASTLQVNNSNSSFLGSIQGDGSAGTIALKITDQNGKVLKTFNVSSGADGNYDWQWDGKDMAGKSAPVGTYTVQATPSDGGQANVLLKDSVGQVSFDNSGETRLIFTDGQSANIQDVASIES